MKPNLQSFAWPLAIVGVAWAIAYGSVNAPATQNTQTPTEANQDAVEAVSDCPEPVNIIDNEVILLDSMDTTSLPFCGLTYGREDGTYWTDGSYTTQVHYCYDFGGWDGHEGKDIINLDD